MENRPRESTVSIFISFRMVCDRVDKSKPHISAMWKEEEEEGREKKKERSSSASVDAGQVKHLFV